MQFGKHNFHCDQTGAALVVALIMLLIMTLLGVSTIDTTVTEEKMAGQYRNRQLSFEAAEAALREGEATAIAFPVYEPTDGSTGLHLPPTSGDPVWEASGTTWLSATTSLPGVTLAQAPAYTTEYIAYVPRDPFCGISNESAQQDCGRYAYRVSARGWGGNTVARSTVQSTVITRK